MRQLITCATPDCDHSILLREDKDPPLVCPDCRSKHSLKVLKIQKDHEKPIREVILDARIFKSANGMADYVGVSFVTMYNWIKKYFGMYFQEFRRTYICKSESCYLLNISRSSYSRKDYILKKIRSRSNYCACFNLMEPEHIMTNCPPDLVRGILRGYPVIKKISDKRFSLAPNPVHFKRVKPVKPWKRVKPIHRGSGPKPIHVFHKLRKPFIR